MDITALNGKTNTNTVASKNAAETQDRFLKLLVAQMNNQDPLNPMDNAQVTSQMAQIQQVTGLSTLDSSIKTLGLQFGQMQALQSISLVGREVSVPGNKLYVENGAASGSYTLDSAANAVKLEMLGPAGNVIDTINLGAQGQGRQEFTWPAGTKVAEGGEVKYRITATQGTAAVTATTYMHDKVGAIFSQGGALMLNLDRLGPVAYADVAAVD